jgi:hypothetical protein
MGDSSVSGLESCLGSVFGSLKSWHVQASVLLLLGNRVQTVESG